MEHISPEHQIDRPIANNQHADLEVVELEGFSVVGMEVVSNKDDSCHQNNQQHYSHSHPCLMCHMHLQKQSQARSEVKYRKTWNTSFNRLFVKNE